MKQLFLGLLAIISASALWAQTVTLQFAGVNKNRNYQVVIDGTTYNSAEAVGSGKNKMLTMNNLSTGSHTLAVYPAGASVTSDSALYSNTFQLRPGYDMNILIQANGSVSFTEERSTQTAVSSGSYSAEMAMSSADFNRLAQSVRSKWLQASRVNALRTAFTTTTHYFTTDQIGQLLSYVNAEPTRLELAKSAYARVIDPANYRSLYELFSSESLRNELDFFLRNTTIRPGGDTNTSADTSTVDNTPTRNDDASAPANTNTNTAQTGVSSSTDIYSGRTPVASRSFNQLMRRVRNQRVQQGKVAVLTDAFNSTGNYFTTVQLRQLLTPITAESDRLTLAKLAYARTADTANFRTLYDLFKDRYNQMELDHFVRYGSVGTTVTTPANNAYAHRIAISDADYARLDLKVRFHLRQSSTVAEIKKAFSGNQYFTAEQIRQWLSLVTSEEDRLALAKLAYLRINNPNTFTSLYDLFSNQSSRDELDRYIAANRY